MKASCDQDTRELYRGAVVSGLGHLLKLAQPVLLILVVRLYGAEPFGLFALIQGMMLLAMRICLLGLDKGLIWWIARLDPHAERRGLPAVILVTLMLAAGLSALICLFGASYLAVWYGHPSSLPLFRIMALALVPMTLMEVLLHAILGKRMMAAQILVRDGVVPLTLTISAVLLHLAGFVRLGFGIAFVIASVAGCLASIFFFNRAFATSKWHDRSMTIPPLLLRFSLGLWLAELANSLLLRLDLYLVAWMTDPQLTGVYAAVLQVGNGIRAVRRSLDPLLTALLSRISAAGDAQRLRASFSRATTMIMLTQMPIFAFVIIFAPWLMQLFGHGFGPGSTPVVIICLFWLLNGVIGLNGIIVTGFGRSDLTFINTLATIFVEAILLIILVPRFGLTGGAFAVGLAYTVQNCLQLLQARRIAGDRYYHPRVLEAALISLASFSVIPVFWLSTASMEELMSRIFCFTLYLVASGCGLVFFFRQRRLQLP